jgi:DNA-binding CsgD family transcriptional regulator
MDKQVITSGHQEQIGTVECPAGGVVCLDELTATGQPDDGVLESALIFDFDKDIPLTKREGEILRLIVSGQTNKQIAARLSRSERTVEYHRNRLMHKIGSRNAAQLVKSALAVNLV